ncbi:ATP-binding protein [Streptomyces sparsogenes]|uniref:ATP-binding protein n=1 Tax=Streptomyces sparsogenes TaxID=67365 RepID=UPI00340BB07A
MEDLKGFKPLSPGLSPEARDLARALRGLFRATGKSLREFASCHHVSAPSLSRYFAGERIPDKQFLDVLMKAACAFNGVEVTADMQGHLYRRHRDALLAVQPARYREQMASDRLEDAVLQKEQAELRIRDLEKDVSDKKCLLGELESSLQLNKAAYVREQQRLGAELELHRRRKAELEGQCEHLRAVIEDLETALEEAVRERDAAQRRCTELEAELAAAEELAEREALERQVQEERLRMAMAADTAEQHRVDLERVHREAEQVRLAAARDAASRREEAEAKAREIIEEATTRVTRIRPSVVSRSAALRQLRNYALDAGQSLHRMVEELSRGNPEEVDITVKPIGIDTKDEIGAVARAFHQAHYETVRLAAEQVLLRRHINSVSSSITRRNLTLLESQLTLLSDLEDNEADRDRLENLFKLDHLATRMRRNVENLLTLVGEQPRRRWSRPVPLVDVLRAASSEVEQYERIELVGVPEAGIHGRAVIDLVHLLAELLENATVFSPPHTKVRVTGTRLPDGRVVMEIHDEGIGLTTASLAAVNDMLAHPPTVDTAVSECLGLFVVGCLSHRHGIRVQLRPSDDHGGTASLVMLPDAITHG